MTFILKIELGNDAMQFDCDVAAALLKVAANLSVGNLLEEGNHGHIHDTNGNRVGSWEVE